jgi:hypothetical protein
MLKEGEIKSMPLNSYLIQVVGYVMMITSTVSLLFVGSKPLMY